VEQIGQHPDASLLELGGPRVLRVVDEVAVEVLGDQPLRLGSIQVVTKVASLRIGEPSMISYRPSA
jgi:hypothetical protein